MTTKTQTADALAVLRPMLPAGTLVYTKVESVAPSGLSRTLSAYVVHEGEIVNITPYVARAIGETYDPKRGAFRVQGGGMDMGFDTVYRLSATLFGVDGRGAYALRQRAL